MESTNHGTVYRMNINESAFNVQKKISRTALPCDAGISRDHAQQLEQGLYCSSAAVWYVLLLIAQAFNTPTQRAYIAAVAPTLECKVKVTLDKGGIGG